MMTDPNPSPSPRFNFALAAAALATFAAFSPPARADEVFALHAQEADATFPGYRFLSGQSLPEVRIHYATAGTPRKNASGEIENAVLVQHWTSASSEAVRSDLYVQSLYAPGKPLDAGKYFLVFIDSVGHGHSSKPSDGLHAKFPNYGYRDMVDLQHKVVVDVLHIHKLHAIVGLSMGGMNAWLWAEQYPANVEAIMPIVSLPAPIAGRNLLWRRFVEHQIRSDPDWKSGEYTSPPRGWTEAFPVFRMMLDGVPHLQAQLPDAKSADAFIRDASTLAAKSDANDILYSLESSSDYAPQKDLAKIEAKVFALNFSDDEFNPPVLGLLESSMAQVKHGRYVLQPGNDKSFGHFTQAHPDLWAGQVQTFLDWVEQSPARR